jgi:hypothetical protein
LEIGKCPKVITNDEEEENVLCLAVLGAGVVKDQKKISK